MFEEVTLPRKMGLLASLTGFVAVGVAAAEMEEVAVLVFVLEVVLVLLEDGVAVVVIWRREIS